MLLSLLLVFFFGVVVLISSAFFFSCEFDFDVKCSLTKLESFVLLCGVSFF